MKKMKQKPALHQMLLGCSVAIAAVVAGCSRPPPPPIVTPHSTLAVKPLNEVFAPGQSRQEDVLRVMGNQVTSQAMGVQLNADGTVPLIPGAAVPMNPTVCRFPSMVEFPQLTVWLYDNLVLQTVPNGRDVTRSACFLFNADGGLLEVKDVVTR